MGYLNNGRGSWDSWLTNVGTPSQSSAVQQCLVSLNDNWINMMTNGINI